MARPTNAERYSPDAQKDLIKVLCGEAIVQLRKKIKHADANTLAGLVTKLLPVVLDDDTQSNTDVTMELLARKAVKVQVRIKDATEQQQVSEAIEDEDSDE